MEQAIFQDCLEAWKANNGGNSSYWKDLGKRWNVDGEILRNRFKNIRRKLGIKREDISVKEKNKDVPKILVLDIETSPLVCFSWGIYDQRINPESIIHDWFVLSFSAKHLFDDNIISEVLTSKEVLKKDDKRIIRDVWKLIDDSDIIISFNGDSFDLRKLNTRFALHELPPPSFYKSVDLYRVAKDNFAFTSNSLAFVNSFLGIEEKGHTGFGLWKRCYEGDEEALKEMQTYNKNDSKITESLYLKILPWIKNHPNLGLYTEEETQICPKCGSDNIYWDEKYYYTLVNRYDTFRCLDCKAIGRAKKSDLTKEKSKNLLR